MMLVIGSRGSQLALWQANYVKERLEARGAECRIEIIKTTGDKITDSPLHHSSRVQCRRRGGGQSASSRRKSKKPSSRAKSTSPFTASKTSPPNSRKASSSPHSRSVPIRAMPSSVANCAISSSGPWLAPVLCAASLQLCRFFVPNLDLRSIRGNVDTRINKVERGEYDAIVLAAAGLNRLGWGDIISEIFRPDIICPAVGQGALAVETLEEGAGMEACAPLDDPWTRLPVAAERSMLLELGGGCQVPIGAFGSLENTELFLTGAVFSPEGAAMVRYTATGDYTKPSELGRNVAQVLLQRGARELLCRERSGLSREAQLTERSREQAS